MHCHWTKWRTKADKNYSVLYVCLIYFVLCAVMLAVFGANVFNEFCNLSYCVSKHLSWAKENSIINILCERLETNVSRAGDRLGCCKTNKQPINWLMKTISQSQRELFFSIFLMWQLFELSTRLIQPVYTTCIDLQYPFWFTHNFRPFPLFRFMFSLNVYARGPHPSNDTYCVKKKKCLKWMSAYGTHTVGSL